MTDYKNMVVRYESAKRLIDSIIDGLITGLMAAAFVVCLFLAQSVVWG